MRAYGPYVTERTLLQGRVKLIIDPVEVRMAMWINAFGLVDMLTGEDIIPLHYSYNFEKGEEQGDSISIFFRIYPNGTRYYDVLINPHAGTFIYENSTYKIEDFSEVIKAADHY